MQFTKTVQNTSEQISANFYLSENPTLYATRGIAGIYKKNMRGIALTFNLTPANSVKGFGIDVITGDAAGQEEGMICAGILDSKITIGIDEMINTWVLARVYGYMDRILINTGLLENDLFTLWTAGAGISYCIGFKRTSLVFNRNLTGTFTFDGAVAAGETIVLGGSGTAGSWTATPGVNGNQIGDFLNPGAHGFVGYTPLEFPTVPEDIPTGVVGVRRGFVATMGQTIITA